MKDFEEKLTGLINSECIENDSNTPDFLLAEYLNSCLKAWNTGVKARDKWYGVNLEPCNSHFIEDEKTTLEEITPEEATPKKEGVIELVAKGISVDSGTIAIMDECNCTNAKYDDEKLNSLGKVFAVSNGGYNVKWRMPNTWNGKVSGEGMVMITSGTLVVIDPCYVTSANKWSELLKDTDFLKSPPVGWVILDQHGGDGEFTVEITLEKINT